jgi:hypothetical protein
MPYEMNAASREVLNDLFLEYFCSVYGAGRGRHASYEDLSSVGFEDFFNAPPMGDLEWSNGWTNGDRVKAEQAMAEHNWMLG